MYFVVYGSHFCKFKSIELLYLLGRRFGLNVLSARQYWDCN